MRFKTPALEAEFKDLDKRNERLKEAALYFESLCDTLGLDEPVITCIDRDGAANAKVGGIDNSPHLITEAIDFRSSIYKQDEIQDLLKDMNLRYKYGNKPALIYHKTDVNVMHLHMQIHKNYVHV